MGIDASTTSTGWSIFDGSELVTYGVIKPEGADWRERLIHEGKPLTEIINKYKPDQVYMEDVPKEAKGGSSTLIILGAVQGYFLGIFSSFELPVELIAPTSWRSKADMYDGTKEGKKREKLKQKAIEVANNRFKLDLLWNGPNSKKSEDDIAEAILICATMIGAIGHTRRFGRAKGTNATKMD